ncbi:restriction endonuclease subunit S [Rodentibacter pneumotropicus]|uniref:Type II restriction endonuclease n=2 Tax=Rodentibacter pneumotropicus TaxID=758 RepID=A0A4S2PZ25_9PAST|nr:restriction endonuclease subunit S [Rodentibacter pneumotropicus]THA09372.1 type II restriction endonuclease [Rodentibacter pneumotropicus]
MQQVKWAEFELRDLFVKITTKKLKYKTNDLPSEATEDFDLPALTAGIQNQGLNNYVPRNDATILKNVISISANGANTGATFYQNKEFTVLQDAYAIKWKYTNDLLTDNQYLFLTGSISKAIYGNYEWTNKAGWERIKENKILLPIKNLTQIDFDFMENFISQLEVYRLSQLEAYLLVTGLKDYQLTSEEEKVLEDFQNGEVKWEEVELQELFQVETSKKRFDANKVTILNSGYPYIVRTAMNNGVRGYLKENEEYLNEGNTISFGQDTATMFYQKRPYFTGDKIKILKSRFSNFNTKEALFFITLLGRAFSIFSWGSSSFSEKMIKSQKIIIPQKYSVNEEKFSEIDFNFMQTLISAVQKLVIKDVVLYADRKIAATKEVIKG